MFVNDLKDEFYKLVVGKRILVIVNYDVDAICANNILSTLFRYENMVYSVVPIMGISGLERAYNDNKEDIKHVILINCAGCIDILTVLQPEEDVIFFVCDSHRPYDVCNVYSENQVRILGEQSSDDNIPEFSKVFRDSEDEDSSEEEEENEREETRTEKLERKILKERERRQWTNEYKQIMFEYLQYSYYGRSSALKVFELAWKLSKDSMDMLWWAIVGITEQLLLGKIESSSYVEECTYIQSHISRLIHKKSDNMQTFLKIVYEKDLHLALYRHWNVHESLKYSLYSACKLKLWTLLGEKSLSELLVEMGLPLAQARQNFSSMDLVLKKEFYSMIEKLSEKYNLQDIVYSSFTLQYGYRNRYSGADYVYSMLAVLESIKNERTPEHCFLEAMDVLTRSNKNILDHGIEMAKQLLTAIFKQVQSSLEMHQIHSAGPFLYYILNEENPFFSFPYGLLMLSRFILNGHVAVSRNRRAGELPLVASCPIDVERGLCLMIGIPPVRDGMSKNFFGKAFEHAASKSKTTVSQDFFDTSIIQIRQSDQTRFLDALTVVLS